jgi:TetR/AcrR family transcriptional repressor of nem operon
MSEAEKLKSHKRILDAAARLMRERGVEATSVAHIMSAAGLTHGGFYRHFPSKDALAAAAFRHAVDGVVSDVEQASSPEARAQARDRYVATYLSDLHVKDRGQGCPLAAIGAEAARLDDSLRAAAAEAVWRMAGLLPTAEACGPADRSGQGIALVALLLGTVTLARLAERPEEAAAILSAGRTGVDALERSWPARAAKGSRA